VDELRLTCDYAFQVVPLVGRFARWSFRSLAVRVNDVASVGKAVPSAPHSKEGSLEPQLTCA
ncbi:MAG: hypothetical protein ACKO38_01415, partial [Planctomycetota bacterium]